MYGTIVQHELKQPHLTFQWLPGSTSQGEKTQQEFLMGTYTDEGDESGNSKKHVLQVAEVEFVNSGSKQDDDRPLNTKAKTKKLIRHEGDVNKARYMPSDPTKVATISGEGIVYLFDLNQYGPVLDEKKKPTATLSHHKDNGFGLSWHPRETGKLLTAADDGSICLWSTESEKPSVWKHEEGVNDLKWHNFDQHRFGAVTEDACFNIYDDRSEKPAQLVKPHDAPVNSLSFNYHDEYLVATASHDHTVALFDLRYLNDRLSTFTTHSKPVDAVQWSPHNSAILASSARDRRVILNNITHIGEELAPEDSEDAPPEVSFMHGGHKQFVNDMDWNPDHEWVFGSIDNECVQIWRPIDSLVGVIDVDPQDDELEYR